MNTTFRFAITENENTHETATSFLFALVLYFQLFRWRNSTKELYQFHVIKIIFSIFFLQISLRDFQEINSFSSYSFSSNATARKLSNTHWTGGEKKLNNLIGDWLKTNRMARKAWSFIGFFGAAVWRCWEFCGTGSGNCFGLNLLFVFLLFLFTCKRTN